MASSIMLRMFRVVASSVNGGKQHPESSPFEKFPYARQIWVERYSQLDFGMPLSQKRKEVYEENSFTTSTPPPELPNHHLRIR